MPDENVTLIMPDLWQIREDEFLRLCQQIACGAVPQMTMQRRAVPQQFDFSASNIATITLQGIMTKYADPESPYYASTADFKAKVQAAGNDPSVDGILLLIETPGGSVMGTPEAANAVARAAKSKPVYVLTEELCCSAGYYVASQATKVFGASESAEFGSLGTYSTLTDWAKMFEQVGVKRHVVATGQWKGLGVMGTEITAEQIGKVREHVNAVNDLFKTAVKTGRKLTQEHTDAIFDGWYWLAAESQSKQLIDGIASLDEVTAAMREEIGTPKKKGTKMTTDTKTEPVAATITELKAKFPDAGDSFYVAQLTAGATLDQARDAYVEHVKAQAKAQAEENAKLKADIEAKAKAEAEASKNGGKPTGQEPLAEGKGGDKNEATGDFIALAREIEANAEKAGKPISFRDAKLQARKKDPEAFKAYLKATSTKGAHSIIDEF